MIAQKNTDKVLEQKVHTLVGHVTIVRTFLCFLYSESFKEICFFCFLRKTFMLYNLHFVTSNSNDPKMQLMGMSIV